MRTTFSSSQFSSGNDGSCEMKHRPMLEWIRSARKNEKYWMDWASNKFFSCYLPGQLTNWDLNYLYNLRNNGNVPIRTYLQT